MRKTTSSLAHYSMLPPSGYSSTGCSPAEPISASPDTLCPRHDGWSIIVPPEIRVSMSLNQRIYVSERLMIVPPEVDVSKALSELYH